MLKDRNETIIMKLSCNCKGNEQLHYLEEIYKEVTG